LFLVNNNIDVGYYPQFPPGHPPEPLPEPPVELPVVAPPPCDNKVMLLWDKLERLSFIFLISAIIFLMSIFMLFIFVAIKAITSAGVPFTRFPELS